MKVLKVLTVSLFASALFASAGNDIDIEGQITSVDNAQKSITIANYNGANVLVRVSPYTELKGDDCGAFGMYDTNERFNSLKSGMFVKIDGIPNADGTVNAKEIEWKCGRRAY